MATNRKFQAKNGLDNNSNTIDNLGASGSNFGLAGGHSVTMTSTGTTSVTLPTSGTLATLGDIVTPNNGTLTLAVSGTGLSGSASFTANQSGDSTFTVTSNATSANTGSTVVARDSSGNFSAGTVTASLTGAASLNVLKSGDTMTGALVLNADPSAALGAATKQYVDNIAGGLNAHAACATATTATLATSSGGTVTYNNGTAGVGATLTTTGSFATIGAQSTADGDRILVKDEATQTNNGVYVRTSETVLTRASDFDDSPDGEVAAGDFVYIQSGTLGGTQWVQTTAGTITIGTTAIVFSQLSGAGTVTGGTGITVTGNSVALSTVSNSSTGTFLKLTRDAYGRVTGTTAVVASDVTGLVDGTYVKITGDTMTGNLIIQGDGQRLRPQASTTAGQPGLRVENNSGVRQVELLAVGTTSATTYGAAAGSAVLNTATGVDMNFSTSDTLRATITSAGNVGIGTASPTNYGTGYVSLAVNGSTGGVIDSFSSGSRATSMFSTATESRMEAFSRPLVFYTGSTERVRIDTDGNVGIGGISPGPKLYVAGGTDAVQVTNGTYSAFLSADIAGFTLMSQESQGGSGLFVDDSIDNLVLLTNSSERIRIGSTGNTAVYGDVTVSKTNPSLILNATASENSANLFFTQGGLNRWRLGKDTSAESGSNAGSNLFLFAYADNGSTLTGTALAINRATLATTFGGSVSATGGFIGSVTGASSLNVLKAGDTMTGALSTTALTTTSGGVTVPNGQALNFVDSNTKIAGVGTGGTSVIGFHTNNTERARISTDGNFSIGTGGSSARLTVETTTATTAIFKNTSAGGFAEAYVASNDRTLAIGQRSSTNAGGDLAYIYSGTATPFAIFTNTAERMRVTSAGNVGIGTTNPSQKLVVSEAGAQGIEFGPTAVASAPAIVSYNRSTAAYLQLTSIASQMVFQTGTTPAESMRLNSSGNLGIGRSSPSTRLDVGIPDNGGITITNTADTHTGWLYFADTVSSAGSVSYDHSSNAMRFYTSGAERFRISTAGALGVGGTNYGSAGQVLTSAGAAAAPTWSSNPTFSTLTTSSGSLGTTAGSQVFLATLSSNDANADVLQITNTRTAAGTDWTTAGPRLQQKVDSTWLGWMQFGNGDGTAANTGGISFGTGSTTTSAVTNPERMRLNSSGNLGLGTTNPTNYGAGYVTSAINGSLAGVREWQASGVRIAHAYANSSSFVLGSVTSVPTVFLTGGTERMRLDTLGNLAIGTTSSACRLDVNIPSISANTTTTIARFSDNVSADLALRLIAGATTGGTLGRVDLYSNASTMSFSPAATERMRIDASGNVGVGTTTGLNDSARFKVQAASNQVAMELFGPGSNNSAKLTFANDNNSSAIAGVAGDLVFYATRNTERMRINSSGNVGIGTSSPTSNGAAFSNIELRGTSGGGGFLYAGDTAAKVRFGYSGASGGGFLGTVVSEPLLFQVNNAEAMRITSGGYIGINGNTTGASAGLQHQIAFNYPGGGTCYGLAMKSGTNVTNAITFVNSSDSVVGTITSGASSVAYNTTSDARLKKNVTPVGSFGAVIDAINVVSFDWKSDNEHQRAGFIAQDLHTVAPEAVKVGDSNAEVTDPWAVDASKLIPMLVKEIQELRARVAALEA